LELTTLLGKLSADHGYRACFQRVFGSHEVQLGHVLDALAQYQRSLVFASSAWDRHALGAATLSADEQAGEQVFVRHCARCHVPPLFTDQDFHNNGLDTQITAPALSVEQGRMRVTNRSSDLGKFKTPSLRELTRSAFQRTLLSGAAPFDRYIQGADPQALSEAAKRGHTLFESERLACSQCHSGFDFSDHVYYRDAPEIALVYHNTGLYNTDGLGAYPEPNTGTFNVTQNPDDMGMFKVPTLRNIALTAPYMHDGSIATLSEVFDHYAAAGRTLASGPYAGVGSENPRKDSRLKGFTLSEQERADLLAFLSSLTDQAFIEDEAFSDPWR
jgi:cytochrome c peroxidase